MVRMAPWSPLSPQSLAMSTGHPHGDTQGGAREPSRAHSGGREASLGWLRVETPRVQAPAMQWAAVRHPPPGKSLALCLSFSTCKMDRASGPCSHGGLVEGSIHVGVQQCLVGCGTPSPGGLSPQLHTATGHQRRRGLEASELLPTPRQARAFAFCKHWEEGRWLGGQSQPMPPQPWISHTRRREHSQGFLLSSRRPISGQHRQLLVPDGPAAGPCPALQRSSAGPGRSHAAGRGPQILGCDPHPAARRGCGSRGTRGCPRAWPRLQSVAVPRGGALCRPPAAVACKRGLPGTRSPHWGSRGPGAGGSDGRGAREHPASAAATAE